MSFFVHESGDVVIMLTLSSLEAPEVVCMTTYGAPGDDIVGIMTDNSLFS